MLYEAIQTDLDDLAETGRIRGAEALTAATGHHFNSGRPPHYFTGNLAAPLVLVHLNAKQDDEPEDRWNGPVPTLESYLDDYAHFGARQYGPNSPRIHKSRFDKNQIRFLQPFGAIPFIPDDAADAHYRNLELSVDAKAQLELVPYGSASFNLRGHRTSAVAPHFDRLLDVVTSVERTHVMFCGVVFDTLLARYVVNRHEFRLDKLDGSRTANKYRFANVEIPHDGQIVRAGIASHYAIQGIPTDEYASQCANRY